MTYILAIDQGTTSTRAVLFDENADIIHISQKELELFYPKNGWVEQNADTIWVDVQETCRTVVGKVDVTQIKALGITNQRETTIVWDKETGKPVYNAIVWQDRRTAGFCDDLKSQGFEQTIQEKTGLLCDPYFSGTKIKWILDNVDGARARADKGELLFGTIDCFLLWHLTGGAVHATDITNASRTLMFNIVTQDWDDALLDILNISRNMLPSVKDNSTHFGDTTDNFIGQNIPITGMAGDQQAALIGQACFDVGMVKSTYGTGCFVVMNTGDTLPKSNNKMLATVAYRLNGKICYALEGAIFVSGAAIQWLRDGLGIISSASETENLAMSVDDNGGVYMVPAFTGLGAPHWNPHARGSLSGLTRGTTRAHIVRAGLEAQGYQTADLLDAMADDAGIAITELRIDGGMVSNDWVCQFIADITDTPVVRPDVIETTVLGAAYLAGLHVGIFKSLNDIQSRWEKDKTFKPKMTDDTRIKLYAGWQKAVRGVLAE